MLQQAESHGRPPKDRRPITIRDELILEAHPQGDTPHIPRGEGKSGFIRIYLNEVRYLAEAMCAVAAEVAGIIAGDEGNSV